MSHGIGYLVGELLALWLICKILEVVIIGRFIKNFYVCVIISSIIVIFYKAYSYINTTNHGYGSSFSYNSYKEQAVILIILPVIRMILYIVKQNNNDSEVAK